MPGPTLIDSVPAPIDAPTVPEAVVRKKLRLLMVSNHGISERLTVSVPSRYVEGLDKGLLALNEAGAVVEHRVRGGGTERQSPRDHPCECDNQLSDVHDFPLLSIK